MLSQVFRLNPYHIYHMCHIKAQNMIDMTSMIATVEQPHLTGPC